MAKTRILYRVEGTPMLVWARFSVSAKGAHSWSIGAVCMVASGRRSGFEEAREAAIAAIRQHFRAPPVEVRREVVEKW
jgi:hypothetical protein